MFNVAPNKTVAGKPRIRVSKACDYCRTKKLKCDGLSPTCSRCSKVYIRCTYTGVEKKATNRQSTTNHSDSIVKDDGMPPDHIPSTISSSKNSSIVENSVEERLTRIENILISLTERLVSNGLTPRTEVDITKLPDHEMNDLQTEKRNNDNNDNDRDEQILKSPKEQTTPDEQNYNGQYFGSHCTFSVFSPKGLSYISSKCNNQNSMVRVVKMQRDVYYILYNQYRKRVEPAPENDVVPIPSQELTGQLVESFLKTPIGLMNCPMESQEIQQRFKNYYDNELKGINKRRFKQSEQLILHAIIGLGASGQVAELSKRLNINRNEIIENEIRFFKQVEEKHMMCALFYYHRLTILEDGLDGIKAILLLITYSESSLIPDLDYLLISSIVRFAQSIGLHRRESLYGFSKYNILIRKMVWLNCYVYDKDLCLKSGKPPIINDLDVSSVDDDEYFEFLEDSKNKAILKLKGYKDLNFGNLNHIEEFLKILIDSSFGISRYFENLKFKIAKISSKVYFNLFSATSLDGKTKKDVMETVKYLNEILYNFKESIPAFIRPGFEIKIPRLKTEEETEAIYTQAVKLQLSYHLNVMNINKIGLNKDWNDNEVSSRLCIESSRQIIQLVQRIKEDNSSLYLTSLFILLSASVVCFSYIIENPTKISTKYDILTMDESTNRFMERLRYMELQSDPVNTMKFLSVIHVIKNFVKISTELYNKANENIEENSELKISNNDSLINILEYELSKCFKQIKEKDGIIDENNIETSISGLPNNTPTPLNYANGTGAIIEPVNNYPINGISINSLLQNQEATNSLNLNEASTGQTIDENRVPTFEEFMNEDLIDITYFSQPLFNIPNFLLGET